jgi:hypothetical protein
VLRSLLALAVLIPTGVLFVQLWNAQSDRSSFADSERLGVEYLTGLGRVTGALTDTRSAVVAGRPVQDNALGQAVAAMAAVDNRIGDGLRTRERWAGLRAKIESLPKKAEPAATIAAYGEAADLLLALFGKVRENSQLIRDPDADSYYLQDGASQELPEAIVATGHLADLLTVAAKQRPAQRAAGAGDLTAARAAVLSPTGDLAEDLRTAVDNSQSRTLGESLISRLDRFRRAIDALAAIVGPGALSADQVGAARTEAQAAAADLSATMLTELDNVIKDRLAGLGGDRLLAAGAMALTVLLAAAPLLVALLRRSLRRRATAARGATRWPHAPPSHSRPDSPDEDRTEREWARAAR